MTHADFIADRAGSKKWVLAQRMTDSLRARYGSDCVNLTRKRYAAIECEYRTIYGDPYDAVRAELYLALQAARAHMESCFVNGPSEDIAKRIDAALLAEANAK